MSNTDFDGSPRHRHLTSSRSKRPTRGPIALGRFGPFGGRFVPETLMDALNQLSEAYEQAKADPAFQAEMDDYWTDYVGRPSPLYRRAADSSFAGGADIYLKREDLNHTGAHKINNAIGQVLLAKRMGKTRVIAETGAGQHGVATATACALTGLECTVYMGEEDIRRQKLNVFNMRTMGATVVPVTTGSRTLRDATNEAMRDWMGSSEDDALHDRQRRRPAPVPDDRPRLPVGHRPRGPAAVPGPARPPARRRRRLRRRRLERRGDVLSVHRRRRGRADRRRGRRPRARASATTPPASRRDGPACCTAASATSSRTTTARPSDVHSISAGLDYPGVGPEHSYWKDMRPRPLREHHRRRGPGRLPRPWPAARASCRPWNRATPSPRRSRRPAGSAPARCWSSASPAAATRTPTRSPGSAASRCPDPRLSTSSWRRRGSSSARAGWASPAFPLARLRMAGDARPRPTNPT